jgi:hypothetical protein
LVNHLAVSDFGKEVPADPDTAIQREGGTYHPMCSEFAFEPSLKRWDGLHEKAMDRRRQFFSSAVRGTARLAENES